MKKLSTKFPLFLLSLAVILSSLTILVKAEDQIIPTTPEFEFSHRFLQDELYRCRTNHWCTLRPAPDYEYSVLLERTSSLKVMLALKNQPEDDLTISYSVNSTTGVSTKVILLSPYTDIETPQTNKWSITILEDTIKVYEDGTANLIVENSLTVPVLVKIKMGFDGNDGGPSIILIILPIMGGLLILSIFTLWCYYRKRLAQQEAVARALQAEQIRTRGERQQVDQEANDRLTEQKIDERFPEAKFEELTSLFEQASCSVCLEEFQKVSPCRKLYCGHIFHSECIRLWLIAQLRRNHASCPNCNKDMMEENRCVEDVQVQVNEVNECE